MQRFAPRSRVEIFRNERTRISPLDPKPMIWCVSYYLGAFRTVWLPYETRCKMGRTSAKVRAKWAGRSRIGIFRKERARATPLDPKLTSWFVSYYLGAFGTFGCLTKLGAKRAELVQKFVPRCRIRIFRNNTSGPPHWTLN